jgi:ribosomal protein L2
MLFSSSGAEVTRQEVESLVTSAPKDGDIMFLRNVGIGLKIHNVPKPKTSTTT